VSALQNRLQTLGFRLQCVHHKLVIHVHNRLYLCIIELYIRITVIQAYN
jgi:hypothetical protein